MEATQNVPRESTPPGASFCPLCYVNTSLVNHSMGCPASRDDSPFINAAMRELGFGSAVSFTELRTNHAAAVLIRAHGIKVKQQRLLAEAIAAKEEHPRILEKPLYRTAYELLKACGHPVVKWLDMIWADDGGELVFNPRSPSLLTVQRVGLLALCVGAVVAIFRAWPGLSVPLSLAGVAILAARRLWGKSAQLSKPPSVNITYGNGMKLVPPSDPFSPRKRSQAGQSLVEAAVTLPILLFIGLSLAEVQVMTFQKHDLAYTAQTTAEHCEAIGGSTCGDALTFAQMRGKELGLLHADQLQVDSHACGNNCAEVALSLNYQPLLSPNPMFRNRVLHASAQAISVSP